jgi:NAD+ kinase
MKIAIYSLYYPEKSSQAFDELIEILQKKNVEIHIESEFHSKLSSKSLLGIQTFSELNESFDLLISVGGDGTILRAITFVRDLPIPIVGQ